jgi:hypothetical protein
MKQLQAIKEHLLAECWDDEVGLWYIVDHVYDDLGVEDSAEVRRMTMQLVRELLETGKIIAGWYAPRDSGLPPWRIVGWPGSIDDILARIEVEWDKLGRDPTVAEVVILQAID